MSRWSFADVRQAAASPRHWAPGCHAERPMKRAVSGQRQLTGASSHQPRAAAVAVSSSSWPRPARLEVDSWSAPCRARRAAPADLCLSDPGSWTPCAWVPAEGLSAWSRRAGLPVVWPGQTSAWCLVV